MVFLQMNNYTGDRIAKIDLYCGIIIKYRLLCILFQPVTNETICNIRNSKRSL